MLEWSAVLGAADVDYELAKVDGQWLITVIGEKQLIAMNQLCEYEHECRYWPPKITLDCAGDDGVDNSSLYAGILLLCFFLITGPYDSDVNWFYLGRGDVEKMKSGELWRAITALTLHSDVSHIIGNIIGCIFLCGAVCQYLGSGVGWLLILLSGSVANLLNTIIHHPPYLYVGASTAIFAAIGILGLFQTIRLYRHVYTNKRYLPLLAVIAIFSVMGTGPKADIMGHFMGAICGIFFGFFSYFLRKYREHRLIQVCCLNGVIVIVFLSWVFACHEYWP